MTWISPRPPPKPVLLFALHALALALLLGLWPTPRALYPGVLRAQAALLYGTEGPPGVVLREGTTRKSPELDTMIEAVDPAQDAPLWRVRFSAVRMGWWPSAALLALLFATPLTARRRTLAALGGLLWLDAFALARIGLEVQRAFLELEASGGTVEGDWLLAARTASEVLNSNIVVIASVLLAWVLGATPRRSLDPRDLLRVLGVRRKAPAARHPS